MSIPMAAMAAALADVTVLLLPGYGDSGAGHWQTLWEATIPGAVRIQQRDWLHPDRDEWSAALEDQVARIGPNVVLAAHSVSCLVVAHWASATRLRVRGALLVAPADPSAAAFPEGITGFAAAPRTRLPFPGIVVASQDDPYASAGFSSAYAASLGARLELLARAGHINASSGLGGWSQGVGFLRELAGKPALP